MRKHYRNPNYPNYRIYYNGKVVDTTTGKKYTSPTPLLLHRKGYLEKVHIKDLINDIWPNGYVPKPKRIDKRKDGRKRYSKAYLKEIKKAIRSGLTYDQIGKKFNIPFGSLGYVINKAGGYPNTQPIIHIHINKAYFK